MEDSRNIVFNTFVGEYVKVITSFATEQGTITTAYIGFILDIDDGFFYLGSSAGAIQYAVKRESVECIEIISESDPGTKVLDALPIPEDDSQVN